MTMDFVLENGCIACDRSVMVNEIVAAQMSLLSNIRCEVGGMYRSAHCIDHIDLADRYSLNCEGLAYGLRDRGTCFLVGAAD